MPSNQAEIDYSGTIDVKLECMECGEPLSVVEYYRPPTGPNRGDFMIYAGPCYGCLERARREGHDDE